MLGIGFSSLIFNEHPSMLFKLYFIKMFGLIISHPKSLRTESICIYSYMFKLQSPPKHSLFDAIHLSRHFFPLIKMLILISFSASAISSCFTSSTLAKYFPSRICFIQGNKKIFKARSGE